MWLDETVAVDVVRLEPLIVREGAVDRVAVGLTVWLFEDARDREHVEEAVPDLVDEIEPVVVNVILCERVIPAEELADGDEVVVLDKPTDRVGVGEVEAVLDALELRVFVGLAVCVFDTL